LFGLSTIHAEVDEDLATKPLLNLPHRDFVVYAGGLDMLEEGAGLPVAPSLIWPTDQAWFVVSEYDFDSTLVGGSESLIRAIDDSPVLETWIVLPSDSLAEDADHHNPV
jgi:hypothetical protein